MNRTTECKLQLIGFPGYGYEQEPGRWRIQVAGVVRQPYTPTIRKRMLLKILGNLMGISDDELMSPDYFQRISPFVSDGAGGERIILGIGGERMVLPRATKRNGHFVQNLFVPQDLLRKHAEATPSARAVRLQLEYEGMEDEPAETTIHLVARRGLSVISDIDDTIKESAINDRRELLANTFIRPFRSVPGMADVYREWEAAGAFFHYVSSSPWQLLWPLKEMLREADFPQGSVHLRYFRLRNHMLQKMVRIKRSGKITSLRRVVGSMPERHFILVGDSGEKDLELYRHLVRKYPNQILAVFIRNLANHPLSAERLSRVREQLGRVPCETFITAQELQQLGQDLVAHYRHGSGTGA